jgi:ArsR family transcriptional regulator
VAPYQEVFALNTTPAVMTKPRANKVPVKPTAALGISDRTLGGLAQVFKLLADESRLKILLALAQDGELHVSALCELLRQSQPAVSHHLTLLRMARLVGYRRDGKHNYYRVESGLVRDLLEQFFADSGNGHKHLQFEDFSLAYKRNK